MFVGLSGLLFPKRTNATAKNGVFPNPSEPTYQPSMRGRLLGPPLTSRRSHSLPPTADSSLHPPDQRLSDSGQVWPSLAAPSPRRWTSRLRCREFIRRGQHASRKTPLPTLKINSAKTQLTRFNRTVTSVLMPKQRSCCLIIRRTKNLSHQPSSLSYALPF